MTDANDCYGIIYAAQFYSVDRARTRDPSISTLKRQPLSSYSYLSCGNASPVCPSRTAKHLRGGNDRAQVTDIQIKITSRKTFFVLYCIPLQPQVVKRNHHFRHTT